tara:strand:- start:756 stop:1781 length:1026 start_codon:yes stop_codon:yes gene_type:complete
MKILITGAAGFIGYHTVLKVLSKKKNIQIVGIDSVNSYYSRKLKLARIKNLKKKFKKKFIFKKINISDKKNIFKIFKTSKFHTVINLAAQAGVRYSLKNPDAYFKSNLKGFYNILEASKNFKVRHLISASSSSVYGINDFSKFSNKIATGHPIQLYAATKRSNELMGHAYSHLYKLPTTFIRFFTVYGPWGRPDMSLFLFVKNILNNKPIYVFNKGKHSRDFTYVQDIVEGINKVIKKIPKANKNWNSKILDQSTSRAPFKILNLGNGRRIKLMKYIKLIEKNLNKKAIIIYKNIQKGDIKDTLSDLKDTKKYISYKPKIKVEEGIRRFIEWYKSYYKIRK